MPEPLGVTLVIGAWNFPFNTGVCPAVTAIAAGNCVVLKPSEMSPHSSNIIKKLFDNYLGMIIMLIYFHKNLNYLQTRNAIKSSKGNLKFPKPSATTIGIILFSQDLLKKES